jgi:hypothetical protein
MTRREGRIKEGGKKERRKKREERGIRGWD